MSFTKSKRLITTALLLTLGSAGSLFAQQSSGSAGMVRISSPRTSSLVRSVGGQTVQQAGGHRMGVVETPCQNGNCPAGNGYQVGGCPTGNCPTGNCPTGNCPGGCPGGCFHGKFGEHYCKHSPDYGYSPPAKYPLHRRGVEYTNYYPQNWYGAGADYSGSYAPMVYQPTDTTQLGYHYQHVPFWQPMPNRLPPRPVPAQWHITAPPVQASRYSNGAWVGYAGGYPGHGVGSYSGMNGSCPPGGISTQPTPVRPTSPQPLKEEVVTPIQTSPQPVELNNGSASVGAEPGTLPPMPTSSSDSNGIPSLNTTPVPANAVAPGKVRRF
jgi:hypothetical protein